MDKRVIFAVAGSGKTTYLINQLNEENRYLLITYTNNNLYNLRTGIIKRFGYFPKNIFLFTYFSFLHSFCYKPFLYQKLKTKGITYELNANKFAKSSKKEYYIDKYGRLYSSRITKLLNVAGEEENIISRISKYFDNLFIDEVQDFGGNDFNFLKVISQASVNHIYVGDFFQHTFDTSRDGNTNSGLHENFQKYVTEFEKMGLQSDTTTLSKSYRCSPTICRFISERLGIPIESHKTEETIVEYIDEIRKAESLFIDKNIVKLFYQEHYKYDCFSRNWGDSKGEDKYFDVCTVLNKTTLEKYQKDDLKNLKAISRNKLYVAISRTKNNLYLVPYNMFTS